MAKIAIEKIRKVRNIRDDSTEIDDLKSSIKEHGLLQPIIVSRNGSGYELVVGHRRYNACKALGWKTIPAIVQDFKSPQIIQLVENMQRKNLSHIEESETIHNLFQKLKVGRTRLGKIIGKDVNWVNKRLALHEVRKHLLSTGMLPTMLIDSMSFDIARAVVKHDQKYWLQMCAFLLGKKWMPDQIEKYCQSVVDPNYQPAKRTYDKKDPLSNPESIIELQQALKHSIRDSFSIIKDDHECIIKLMCTTETSYKSLLKHLCAIGGEVI